ncbi:MAG: dihydrofolate reductase [Candidatus Saccharibacteria bacterium]|nr:dihydrofolate reductase [Candidatus Saccharibacteria bacterium]
MFSLIAAIGKNYELGKDNKLVFHIKEDMKFFREKTSGHPVLMGRKTFESIGRPLPNRQNYVVTRNPELLPDGVEPVSNLKDFLEKNATLDLEIFVIGGASIYAEALPYAKNLYLTEIDAKVPADAFFPTFDKTKYNRKLIKKGSSDDLTFDIVCYEKM